MQTLVKPETKKKTTLAFSMVKVEGGLYAVQILKIEGGRVVGERIGAGTTLGHATCEAGDLLTHFHLYETEQSADDFFKNTRIV